MTIGPLLPLLTPAADPGCGGCGACCAAISLKYSPQEIAASIAWLQEWDAWEASIADLPEPSPDDQARIEAERPSARYRADMTFIASHWRPISAEVAGAINPHLVEEPGPWANYYQCDAYDPATRRCTVYAERPPVCQGFPWYGEAPRPRNIGNFRACSYWRMFPPLAWPPGTAPVAGSAPAQPGPDAPQEGPAR